MIDPSLFLLNLTLFVLAIFLGVELINKVPATLFGTQIVMQDGERSVASLLAGLALMLAMANVVGGFAVTHRMLNMFKKKS